MAAVDPQQFDFVNQHNANVLAHKLGFLLDIDCWFLVDPEPRRKAIYLDKPYLADLSGIMGLSGGKLDLLLRSKFMKPNNRGWNTLYKKVCGKEGCSDTHDPTRLHGTPSKAATARVAGGAAPAAAAAAPSKKQRKSGEKQYRWIN